MKKSLRVFVFADAKEKSYTSNDVTNPLSLSLSSIRGDRNLIYDRVRVLSAYPITETKEIPEGSKSKIPNRHLLHANPRRVYARTYVYVCVCVCVHGRRATVLIKSAVNHRNGQL